MKEFEECEICGRYDYLVRHHVFFGTANRKQSEKWCMVARLCSKCHTDGEGAVHRCRATDLALKERYQRKFEQTHTREEFMKIFGRNWI